MASALRTVAGTVERLRPRHHVMLFGAAFAAYLLVLHPWLTTWGATAEEQRAPLPGDDQVSDPAWQTTRATTIRLAPDAYLAFGLAFDAAPLAGLAVALGHRRAVARAGRRRTAPAGM